MSPELIPVLVIAQKSRQRKKLSSKAYNRHIWSSHGHHGEIQDVVYKNVLLLVFRAVTLHLCSNTQKKAKNSLPLIVFLFHT